MMKKIAFLFISILLLGFTSGAAEVIWTSRLEGTAVNGGLMVLEDGDFTTLNNGTFADVSAVSYLRLGLTERSVMDYLAYDTRVRVQIKITPYDNSGVVQSPFTQQLEVIYSPSGTTGVTVDAEDYRMTGVHKFMAEVTSYSVEQLNGSWTSVSAIPSFLYLEAGFTAERYYQMDLVSLPVINSSLVEYSNTGVETVNLNSNPWATTTQTTEDIELSWNYIAGTEYYDLEWTWVDNYDQTPSTLTMSEAEFSRNSSRVRLSGQSYRIPQTFAKGYLIYRVRGVGRWLTAPTKDLYGQWSSGTNTKAFVQDWPNVITIAFEHENKKNWQYQVTYAEDGKKKEVVQYLDGSFRNRQTVTRINSNHQSVVGETVYDNEGRGVIQILPVPQDEPSIKYYKNFNLNNNSEPYNYENFDIVTGSNPTCTATPADPIKLGSGAGDYYSTAGHATDTDWQKNVPDAQGYPFTQVEYTPDNTGRMRNASGVGTTHKIGSGHETYYYYVQPSQEELNRLFGYKVGYKARYKKNMVVDANGQVSVSYLDAAGKVVATAIVGDNNTQLETLPNTPAQSTANTDLLGKLNFTDADTDQDDNVLYSTGLIGTEEDALRVNTQLPVVDNGTIFHFNYDATSQVYTEPGCDGNPGVSYPYVYDLTISIKDDCGNELYTQTNTKLGIEQIGGTTGTMIAEAQHDIPLNKGSYTVFKELKVNQQALDNYLLNYLDASKNPCLKTENYFETSVDGDCEFSCKECLTGLGTQDDFTLARAKEDIGPNTTLASLSQAEIDGYHQLYDKAKATCVESCIPITNCDTYHQLLLADVRPGGQYGTLDGADILSVYTPGNSYGVNWNSINYLDDNGNPALVEVFSNDGGQTFNLPFTGPIPTADINGRYWIAPKYLSNLTDFALMFQDSWAEALIQYHPEYRLYQYAAEICNTNAFAIPAKIGTQNASINISSETFDSYLRDRVVTITHAQGAENLFYNNDFYGIDFIGNSGDAIYNIDPYFHNTYNTIHLLNDVAGNTSIDIDNTPRKMALMQEALQNYKQQGMSMLEYAIRSVIGGYNLSSPNISTYNTWPTFLATTALTSTQKDQIFMQYKSFYLSQKQQINQLLMDMFGYYQGTLTPNKGIYNGAIGGGTFGFGILPDFSGFAGYQGILNDEVSLCGYPMTFSCFPYWMTSAEFDSKQIRITRLDAMTNNTTSSQNQMSTMTAQADYAMWMATGLCPLTIDMEGVLNQMGIADQLLTDQVWNNVPAMTPDLYTAITGIQLSGIPASAANFHIKGSLSGTSIKLEFIDPAISPTCAVVIPEIDISLPWSSYGNTWHIYKISNSFPVSGTQIKILVTAGVSQSTAQQYVVTYTSCIDLNSCQTEFYNNTALDPNCTKGTDFDHDMLNLLQALTFAGNLTQANVALNSFSQYTSSVLPGFFGMGAIWDGTTGTITNNSVVPAKVFSIGAIPSNTIFVTGFSHLNTTIDVQLTVAANSVVSTQNQQAVYAYTENGVPKTIDFNCSCEELSQTGSGSGGQVPGAGTKADYELKMQNLINHLLSLAATGTVPANGYTCPELTALVPFYNMGNLTLNPLYTLESATCSNSGTSYRPKIGVTYGVGFQIWFSGKNQCILKFNYDLRPDLVNACAFHVTNFSSGPSGYYSNILDITDNNPISNAGLVHYPVATSCTPVLSETYKDPCCKPIAQAPVSCNDAYTTYINYMAAMNIGSDTYASAAATALTQTPPVTLTTAMYCNMTEQHFCDMTYAYITNAYIYYLTNLNVANTSDLLYLSIADFGNTQLGYSNTNLTIAVDEFKTYKIQNPNDNILWNAWFNSIYAVAHAPICPTLSPAPIWPTIDPIDMPCDEWEDNISDVNAQNQYAIYLNQVKEIFIHNYVSGAMSTVVEHFTESHLEKEYHYTLYYYDRAGNLIETVPPKGVNRLPLTPADNTAINTIRATNAASTTENGVTAPQHVLQTDYRYNSLNQLVYQKTPDGGESRFAYDKLGRLVVSQNARQKVATSPQFSYTLYDALGRIIEVGQFTDNAGLTIDDYGHLVYIVAPQQLFDVNSNDWINLTTFARTEVTRTKYDKLNGMTLPWNNNGSMTTLTIESRFGSDYAKNNTRNRVVGTVYQEAYNTDISIYDNGTFYDYDVHGNVKHLIQINNNAALVAINHHIKHLQYEYDLVSGKVNKVIYQKDKQDQFIHRYDYDADNRITIAETSKDNFVYEKDAKYFYYDHGPLARTEIGEKKVQAEDYAYTIQGWIKAVNGEQINENTMMGHDGASSLAANPNKFVARDAFGYALSYFNGDYQSADQSMLNFTSQSPDLNIPLVGAPPTPLNLYNGNIRSMYTALSKLDEASLGTHQTVYTYDQLNRIKSMNGFNVSANGASITSSASGYSSDYTYDANGNLKTMRNFANLATSGPVNSVQMDKFAYHYKVDGSGVEINQLDNVYDLAGPSLFGNADLSDNQLAGNYQYDEIGQLKSDASENISEIKWTVYNKIKEIIYSGSLDGKRIVFDYNSSGKRIAKHVTQAHAAGSTPQTSSTFYVVDAQGNSMSTYEKDAHSSSQLSLLERNIYGSKRVGMEQVHQMMISEATNSSPAPQYIFDNGIGDKRFELTNHLGNVLNAITDRIIPVSDLAMIPKVAYNQSDVVSYADYLPFGQIMPNRHGNDNSYRYGFNGKENDHETNGTGSGTQDYGLRIYSPSIGKFLSIDPLSKKYPDLTPYQFASNSPISCTDLDGAEAYWTADGKWLGMIGGSSQVRIVDAKDVKTVVFWINAANNPPVSEAWNADFHQRAKDRAKEFSTLQVGRTLKRWEASLEGTGTNGPSELGGKYGYDHGGKQLMLTVAVSVVTFGLGETIVAEKAFEYTVAWEASKSFISARGDLTKVDWFDLGITIASKFIGVKKPELKLAADLTKDVINSAVDYNVKDGWSCAGINKEGYKVALDVTFAAFKQLVGQVAKETGAEKISEERMKMMFDQYKAGIKEMCKEDSKEK